MSNIPGSESNPAAKSALPLLLHVLNFQCMSSYLVSQDFVWKNGKISGITVWEINFTPVGTPAYLSPVIQDYLPTCTVQSSDIILSALHMVLALSAKAFSVSTPSAWNSVLYYCTSAELLII